MEIVAFFATATAKTIAWEADKDYEIIGASGNFAYFSFEPTLTYAAASTPTVVGAWPSARFNTFDIYPWEKSGIPLSKGTKIYCATQGSAGVSNLILIPLDSAD